jgi:hypothetical protein
MAAVQAALNESKGGFDFSLCNRYGPSLLCSNNTQPTQQQQQQQQLCISLAARGLFISPRCRCLLLLQLLLLLLRDMAHAYRERDVTMQPRGAMHVVGSL